MTELMIFDDLRDTVDEIAKENGVESYELKVHEDKFTGDNYTTKITRVQIVDKNDETKTIKLLVKITNMTSEIREKTSSDFVYKAEFITYTDIFPVLSKFVDDYDVPEDRRFVYPKFYKGGFEKFKEFMILEDLSFDGFKMFGRRNPLDFKHCNVVLEQLARYHALSFALQVKEPEKYAKILENIETELIMPEGLYATIINLTNMVVGQMPNEEKKKLIIDFISASKDLLSENYSAYSTAPYNVIIHGDMHMSNLLFKHEEDDVKVIFVDWQLVRLASPTNDIVKIIYLSTDKEFRDKYYAQLCDVYYRTLQESLEHFDCDISKIYPRDMFEKHLIDVMPSGIITGAAGGAIFLGNPGEEIQLQDFFGSENLKVTASEQLIQRLNGLADDIVMYKSLRN